jgi:SAM-dependent methyltransferase
MEAIYERPQDYDLEHEGDGEDVAFYLRLISRLKPARVLELAAGSGRVTMPLARAAARVGVHIVGLEKADTMLEQAERKRRDLSAHERRCVTLVHGDMREWISDDPFDLIITPCSSLSHLLTLDDQLATWRCARQNLRPSGRFVADLAMPNLAAYADSMQAPPRRLLEIDIDVEDPRTGDRLVRYKATRYLAHEQRAEIRFLYDKFPRRDAADRYVSDFDCHVYYPREVELLFRSTGFVVEERLGSYDPRPLGASSRALIVIGRRVEAN